MNTVISVSRAITNVNDVDNEYVILSISKGRENVMKISLSLEEYARMITGMTVPCTPRVRGVFKETLK
jgi:hypothetical protein